MPGRLPYELLPVDGSRICILMDRVNPGTIGIVTVRRDFNEVDLAQDSLADDFFCLKVT